MSELIAVSTIVINLIILGLNLKLYTEYFKAENSKKR